ncbi:flagellar hook-associated protein 1 FlgK [Desulfitispora alkaliphila]|uniref:flagellar hook-associated protein FlgK n=1 Tax=Desulfitispora alkaliphila TaxID=622674 RepID=UPI003D20374A
MRTTFFGLEIARKGLQTQQRSLDVTSHNIANANTPGYSRQSAVQSATRPWTIPSMNKPHQAGQVGTGSEVQEIQRMRDQFIDLQVRNESKELGYWDAKADTLQKLEVVINEPSNAGLRTVMDQFWESWQELSKNPESDAVRATVRQRGIAVAETFRHMDRQLTELQQDINATVGVKVDQINSLARQIRDLNDQIVRIEVDGSNANDLRDKRDHLMDELSKIVDMSYVEDQDGSVRITVGGKALVMGTRVNELETVPMTSTSQYNDLDGNVHEWELDKIKGINTVQWKDGAALNIRSGELHALMESVGYIENGEVKGIIPDMMREIDHLANSVVTATNWTHLQGYGLDDTDARVFFTQTILSEAEDTTNDPPIQEYEALAPVRARDMFVDQEIINDTGKIAASRDFIGESGKERVIAGDNQNALALAELKHNMAVITSREYMRNPQLVELPGVGVGNFSDNFTIVDKYGNDMTVNTSKATFDDFFRGVVGQLGIDTQEAERMSLNQEQLLNQQINRRESVSGVSLDEEMAHMIKFQHAYNAAARTMTTMDEMLDTLINRVGLVGR